MKKNIQLLNFIIIVILSFCNFSFALYVKPGPYRYDKILEIMGYLEQEVAATHTDVNLMKCNGSYYCRLGTDDIKMAIEAGIQDGLGAQFYPMLALQESNWRINDVDVDKNGTVDMGPWQVNSDTITGINSPWIKKAESESIFNPVINLGIARAIVAQKEEMLLHDHGTDYYNIANLLDYYHGDENYAIKSYSYHAAKIFECLGGGINKTCNTYQRDTFKKAYEEAMAENGFKSDVGLADPKSILEVIDIGPQHPLLPNDSPEIMANKAIKVMSPHGTELYSNVFTTGNETNILDCGDSAPDCETASVNMPEPTVIKNGVIINAIETSNLPSSINIFVNIIATLLYLLVSAYLLFAIGQDLVRKELLYAVFNSVIFLIFSMIAFRILITSNIL